MVSVWGAVFSLPGRGNTNPPPRFPQNCRNFPFWDYLQFGIILAQCLLYGSLKWPDEDIRSHSSICPNWADGRDTEGEDMRAQSCTHWASVLSFTQCLLSDALCQASFQARSLQATVPGHHNMSALASGLRAWTGAGVGRKMSFFGSVSSSVKWGQESPPLFSRATRTHQIRESALGGVRSFNPRVAPRALG